MRDSPWPLMVILPVLCGLPCSFSPELVTPSEVILILLPSNLSSVTFYFSSKLSSLIIFWSNDIRINRLLLFQFLSCLTEEITHYLFYVSYNTTVLLGDVSFVCFLVDYTDAVDNITNSISQLSLRSQPYSCV